MKYAFSFEQYVVGMGGNAIENVDVDVRVFIVSQPNSNHSVISIHALTAATAAVLVFCDGNLATVYH